ncbi:diaminohydroxyphosphoribosylaminopyrimidine deaminase/5-amino-6-(5-phosphoribosylamino)uracil reductase [Pedobacter sp. UYP30]|uniref:bifunctional diaminohydroxyphosphoribosylaminopyrimidine deaminase/5-amino-6-(5-phosphoribosylamino)uracil reductase RibD n=1 Tax=Pedobacter sp. UYP30 TaxID=1756400 RepID=UPI00339898D4
MNDEVYMSRCLDLAKLGIAEVSPNPMVGCVIVLDDVIIGEGYHKKFGEAHAEPNAVLAVFEHYGEKATEMLREATVYVNLEPCAHFGKTPPCAHLLVKHAVKKVMIGNTDPFSGVNGLGIKKLKEAGIEVVVNILEEECRDLNIRFFTRIEKQRPYIILKWAETANGYFGPIEEKQRWISGDLAKRLTHKWRAEEDAILVGKNTALIDNPALNVRNWVGNNPVRLLIDKDLKVPTSNLLFNDAAKTLIFNEVKTDIIGNVHYIEMEDMQYYLPQKICFQLYLMDIQSVIVEGGLNLLNQFLDGNLWDEARVFKASAAWKDGLRAPQIRAEIVETTNLGDDKLSIYKNSKS